MGKILRISLKLNFNPSTLGCYGFNQSRFLGADSTARPKKTRVDVWEEGKEKEVRHFDESITDGKLHGGFV